MFVDRLLNVVDPVAIEPAVEDLLRDLTLDPAATAAVRDYARSRVAAIHDLAQAMPEADDEIELYRTVAACWLELRFEWQRNNEIMNYQTVNRGHPDPRVVAEAAIGSFMLSRLERCLEASHLELLAHYAQALLSEMHVPSPPQGKAA
jgi:hypothetical protein